MKRRRWLNFLIWGITMRFTGRSTKSTFYPQKNKVFLRKGYGAAIRTCFNYARENNFDVMVILDGDGQHDPSCIPDFINQTLGKFNQKRFAIKL